MFFQPKFYRGKAVPPQIHTSGNTPGTALTPPPPSRGRIGSVPMLSIETSDHARRVGRGGDGDIRRPSLPEYRYNMGSSSDHFDSRYTLDHSQPISPLFGPIEYSSPRTSPPPLPSAPTFDSPSPPFHARTPSQNHSTTPSLGSLSSTSTASYTSESLLTPIKAYLHSGDLRGPLSPSLKPPSRPLPPAPAFIADSPCSSRPSSPCPYSRKTQIKPRSSPTPSSSSRRNLRTPPPPPAGASLYASMPLPPIPTLPTLFSRSGSADTASKRNKRDSQATVRPGDMRRTREARDTMRPLPSLPTIIVEDPIALYEGRRGSEESVQGESDLNMRDIRSALDAFPVPPSHRPLSPPSRYLSRPTTALGQYDTLPAPQPNKKDHRQSSRSTIRPVKTRKIPPPPIPTLQFDLFSISDEMPGAVDKHVGLSEKGIQVVVSEAEEIRQKYLRECGAAY